MKTPLKRIRNGAFTLGGILAIAVVGYRLLGYEWVESLWMVVVTISRVLEMDVKYELRFGRNRA